MSTQNKPFTLSKFSLNRNTTQINLCMLLLILLAILGIVLTNHSFNSVAESQRILLEANEEEGTGADCQRQRAGHRRERLSRWRDG